MILTIVIYLFLSSSSFVDIFPFFWAAFLNCFLFPSSIVLQMFCSVLVAHIALCSVFFELKQSSEKSCLQSCIILKTSVHVVAFLLVSLRILKLCP